MVIIKSIPHQSWTMVSTYTTFTSLSGVGHLGRFLQKILDASVHLYNQNIIFIPSQRKIFNRQLYEQIFMCIESLKVRPFLKSNSKRQYKILRTVFTFKIVHFIVKGSYVGSSFSQKGTSGDYNNRSYQHRNTPPSAPIKVPNTYNLHTC